MPDPKSKPPAPSNDPFEPIADFYKNSIGSPLALLGFIAFLVALYFIHTLSLNDDPGLIIRTYAEHYLGEYLPGIRFTFTIATMACIAGIIYVVMRIREIDNIEYHKYRSIDIEEEEVMQHSTRWGVVLDHVHSTVPAEWRIAVMEADTMLDDAIKRVGGNGDTLGERLKSLGSSNFQHIQAAWDAHKVRNMIAHEGVNFQLTQREARRVIDLYEKVLREFKYI